MRPFASPRRRLVAAVAAAGLAAAGLAAAFTLPQAAAEEADAAQLQWSDEPDGFASLPGLGRGPTTGGADGETVTVTTQEELNEYVTAEEPYVIQVADTIEISPKGTELRVASDKTIVGVGVAGEIVGGGFFLAEGVDNVIIRNLTIRDTLMPEDDPGDDDFDYDAIQLDTADHIWIDHNKLTRMNDGLLDSRKDTTFLTVSWNQFLDNNKTFGIGWTDNVTSQITIHHNWFRGTNSRNPSADNIANLHMYNNYLQDVSGYGNYVRGETQAVIENSYYDNVKNPYYVEEGELVQRGNIDVDSDWGDVTRERGDAFDPHEFYDYDLDPAADVPAIVSAYSGPQPNIGNGDGGGDQTEPGRYEAETSPATCDGSIDADHPGYSGTGFCNTDNATGATAQFSVDGDGSATVTIRFANGGSSDRPADVVVNGSTAASLSFAPTGAWTTWTTASVTVDLSEGTDTVRLVATGSDGLPNIDYLESSTGGSPGEGDTDAQPPAGEPIGYAAMNGGTTGGFGAEVVEEVVLSEYWPGSGFDSPGEAMYQLLYEHKGAPANEGLVVYVDETITPDQLSHEDMRLEKVQNVSILGVGDSGEFDGVGINLIEADNIIIRNLTIHHVADGTGDGIAVQRDSDNVWIDHNEIYNQFDGVEKDVYDALLDVRKGSEYVTISWNYMHDAWHNGLTASSDSEGEAGDLITYANNWIENTSSRNPLVRYSDVHMLNNYFLDVAETGINARMGAQVLVEGNYFENVGTGEVDEETGDVHGPVGWFYGSPEPGFWNLVDNVYAGTTPYEHLESTTDFTVPYEYTALSPEEAKTQAMQNTGVGIVDVTP